MGVSGHGTARTGFGRTAVCVALLRVVPGFALTLAVTPLRGEAPAQAAAAPAVPASPAEFPAWIRAHLAGLKWEPRDSARLLTRPILERSLQLGHRFLLQNQRPEGNFVYLYDFVQKTTDRGDNPVRQAGALWGLALHFEHAPDAATRDALEKGFAFALGSARPGPFEGSLMPVYPGAAEVPTGAAALIGLAAVEYLRVVDAGRIPADLKTREDLRRKLAGLIAFVRAMQLDNGHFSRSLRLADNQRSTGVSPYFDGESLLLLAKAARYLGRADLVPLVEDTALKLAFDYTARAWAEDEDSDATKGFFQWGCMSFAECVEAGWRNGEALGDTLLALAWWMVHTHRTLRRPMNTGYAYEGIIPAYALAGRRGHAAARQDLGWVIDQALHKLTSWQVGGPLQANNPFLAANPTDDPRAVGGVLNERAAPALRIDVTQHQMHAVLLALRHVHPAP